MLWAGIGEAFETLTARKSSRGEKNCTRRDRSVWRRSFIKFQHFGDGVWQKVNERKTPGILNATLTVIYIQFSLDCQVNCL